MKKNPLSLHLRTILKAQKSAMASFRMIESSRARNMTMVMLFLKYLSDHQSEIISIPPHTLYNALYEKREVPFLDELIQVGFQELAAANPQHLLGVFDGIDFRTPPGLKPEIWMESLKDLLESFYPLNLENPSFLSELYDELLDPQVMKESGSFFTPDDVADLLTSLLEPEAGDTICDPTCGIGSLLIACGKYLHQKGIKKVHLYGQELSFPNWIVGKLSLLLHGMDGTLLQGNTILNPLLVDEKGKLLKFDVIVGNPPFSSKTWGMKTVLNDPHNRFYRGLSHENRGDLAFVSHIVETMKTQGGRAGIILPYGPLTREGNEREIRQAFVNENLVDTVISLPDNLFPGTHAVAILILKRGRKNEQVLFINASHESKRKGKRQELTREGMKRILSIFKRRINKKPFARLVSNEELLKDPNLDPRLYV